MATCPTCGSRLTGSGACPNKNAHDRLERQKRPENKPVNPRAIVGESEKQKKQRDKDYKRKPRKKG